MTRRRALFVSHDAGGTIPPVLALAEAFVARGDDAVVLSQPSVRDRAEAAGCTFVPATDLPDYERRRAIEDQIELVARAMTGRTLGDDLVALAHDQSVDVVVVDANLCGALAAAEQLGQPSAVLLHSMFTTYVTSWFADYWAFLEPAINESRAAFGLGPAHDWPSVFAGHDRLLAVVPSSFDAPVPDDPDGMRHYGFLVPRGRVQPGGAKAVAAGYPAGDDPTVLVGLSTTYQRQDELLEVILDALADLPVRGLVTTAGQVDTDSLPQPKNVTIAEYVPHTAVLGDTDVMVTHAGLGSIASALTAGVPLVCTPISRDQFVNADRVSEIGAGVALSGAPTANDVATAIQKVLTDASYRDGARVIADVSHAEGGAARAVEELVELVR